MPQVVSNMSLASVRQILRRHSFTKGLPRLERLEALAEEMAFREDEVIFPAGERSPYLYLLTSGSVCVEISAPVYTVCIQAVRPDGVFGWSSLLDHENTAFRVRAREISTAVRLDAKKLAALCHEDPELGRAIYKCIATLVASRLRATEERLAEFCGLSTMSPVRRLSQLPTASP